MMDRARGRGQEHVVTRPARWARWSVRRRIVTLSSVLLVAAIGLGVGGFAVALDRSLYNAARDATVTQTEQVAAALETDPRDISDAVTETPSRGALIQVLNRGTVVASSDPAIATRPMSSLRPAVGAQLVQQSSDVPGEVGEPHAVVAQGIRSVDGSTLTLVVAVPLDVQDSVRTAVVLLGAGAVALLVLLIVLIDRVVTGALRPVERIRAEVAAIHRVQAGERVTVPAAGDEVSRLAETMNAMLDRLERADETTRRFVSDASHELRSPLATIRAATEVAAAGRGQVDASTPGSTVVDDDLLDVVGTEAVRMQGLVDALLMLARADDEGLGLTLGEVDLDDLVGEEARRLRASGEPLVTVSIAAARVLGDRARLVQVLRNLTDNARRHATTSVRLSVGVDGTEAWFAVDDDGAGVPDEERRRVFDRFVRLDASRERDSGGSGLGLAIVASVVAAHDGRVRVVDAPDGWCRFEVRLPVGGPADQGPVSRNR